MYPPGSGGTFINWAINASDIDTSPTTTTDPVNKNPIEKKYGGQGTAHLHAKVSPHQGLIQQMCWMIYNKPTVKQVYAMNCTYEDIPIIREFDATGVYIVIHNNNDELQKSFARINSVIKWPAHLYTTLIKNSNLGVSVVHPNFDPFNCAYDREFRNWAIRFPNRLMNDQQPVDDTVLRESINKAKRLYNARHSIVPHEVNEKYFNTDFEYKHRIFQIDLCTLFSDKFIPWFEQFMEKSKISSNYNINLVKKVRPDYISSQPTLQWFTSIENWKNTGKFDNFITSHSIIEAEAIRYMLYLKPEVYSSNDSNWDVLSAQEVSDKYFTISDFK